ncbi:hypothetical protein [Planktotalea sp.]|uniref:hypothetical protein n=1 Tax=Planktotalea sp. TaxID=2029877 RepID=UPI003296D38B
MNKGIGLIAALAASLGTSAMAAETWRCELPTEEITSFVGGPLAFSINDDGKSAVVNSPMIMGFVKAPVEIDIKRNDEKVFRAAWYIKNIKNDKGFTIPTLRYSAVLQKATGRFDYYLRSPQAGDGRGAAGKCSRVKQ